MKRTIRKTTNFRTGKSGKLISTPMIWHGKQQYAVFYGERRISGNFDSKELVRKWMNKNPNGWWKK